jgi:hypothetical protein
MLIAAHVQCALLRFTGTITMSLSNKSTCSRTKFSAFRQPFLVENIATYTFRPPTDARIPRTIPFCEEESRKRVDLEQVATLFGLPSFRPVVDHDPVKVDQLGITLNIRNKISTPQTLDIRRTSSFSHVPGLSFSRSPALTSAPFIVDLKSRCLMNLSTFDSSSGGSFLRNCTQFVWY